MTNRGGLAYAHARMRAWRSRLLTRADAAPLFTAADAASMQRVIAALELEDPFARLLRIYQTAIRTYRAPLLHALLRLHEIENVKLLWRGRGDVARLWIDLGPLASFAIIDAGTPNQLAERLARTPYADIAANVARVHGTDVAAAELVFDRWASQRVAEEARRLPRREWRARRLAEMVVRECDAELVRRGAKWYGLASVSGIAPDVTSMRRARLRECRRALMAGPFLLAPAVAVILLAEEEVRAVRALVERQGDETLDAPMLRALAASQLGT